MEKVRTPSVNHNSKLTKVVGVALTAASVVGGYSLLGPKNQTAPGSTTSQELSPNQSNSPSSIVLKCLPGERVVLVKATKSKQLNNQEVNSYAYYPTGQVTARPTTTIGSSESVKKTSLNSYVYYPTGQTLTGQQSTKSINNERCMADSKFNINIELIKRSNIFTAEQINQLVENQPVYQAAAQKYDLPWQLLATIHWRETNLSMVNPANNNGLFQIYNSYFKPGQITESQFQDEVNLTARLLAEDYSHKAHITGDLKQNNSINMVDVGNILMSWNGQSSFYYNQASSMGYHQADLGFLGSPYVSNLINDSFNSNYNKNWKQIRYDHGYALPADQRPGTLPVFTLLMQATDPAVRLNFNGISKPVVGSLIEKY